jgi:hypothetical protein
VEELPHQLVQEEVVVHVLVLVLVAHFDPQEARVVRLEVEHFDEVRPLVTKVQH